MPEITGFSKVAPYLANPLVLIGFCLFLFFGIHRALLKTKLLTPLSQGQSSFVVRMILRYGFWAAIVILVLGFAYAFLGYYEARLNSGPILKVVRYETLPYRSGEPFTVRMFVNNAGSSSITLFGGSHSSFVDKPPSDYNERKQLEERLWAEAGKYTILEDRPLNFQTLTTSVDLMSEEALSPERIDRLTKGSWMYLITVLKDRQGKVMIASCVHTDPAGRILFFCVDHNTP
jgi:hypothetical protein